MPRCDPAPWRGPVTAERVGFEPTRRFNPPTRFPSELLKPLGHLSGPMQSRSGAWSIRSLHGMGRLSRGEIHSDWRERIAGGAEAGGPRRRFHLSGHRPRRLRRRRRRDPRRGVRRLLEGPQGRRRQRDPHPDADPAGRRGRRPLRRQVQAVERRLRRRFAAALGKPIVTLHDPDTTTPSRRSTAPRWRLRRPPSRSSTSCATCSTASCPPAPPEWPATCGCSARVRSPARCALPPSRPGSSLRLRSSFVDDGSPEQPVELPGGDSRREMKLDARRPSRARRSRSAGSARISAIASASASTSPSGR